MVVTIVGVQQAVKNDVRTSKLTTVFRPYIRSEHGIGLCNITKCCTFVCPEHIGITDNAIIPMKERVVDEYYDPLKWIWNALVGKTN